MIDEFDQVASLRIVSRVSQHFNVRSLTFTQLLLGAIVKVALRVIQQSLATLGLDDTVVCLDAKLCGCDFARLYVTLLPNARFSKLILKLMILQFFFLLSEEATSRSVGELDESTVVLLLVLVR